jgi:membrane associated rhomboid family serine protease
LNFRNYGWFDRVLFLVFIASLVYDFVLGYAVGIDKFSHLGGLATGVLLGLYFFTTYRQSWIFKTKWIIPYLLVVGETVLLVLIFVNK